VDHHIYVHSNNKSRFLGTTKSTGTGIDDYFDEMQSLKINEIWKEIEFLCYDYVSVISNLKNLLHY